MKVAVVYNEPVVQGNEAALCSADVLAQVEAVSKALSASGHQALPFPLTRASARRLPAQLAAAGIECAVNLCESLGEEARLQGHVAVLLELARVPYTGSDMLALTLTTDKHLAKKAMAASGIPTPRWALYAGGQPPAPPCPFPLILKPRHEDGSVGIEQDSVAADERELNAALPRLFARHGDVIVEEFVEGREINVALLGYPELSALPVAEIELTGLPAGLWRIVGYRAKWEEGSAEYQRTPRRFPQDAAALATANLAERACRLFGCRDYARVDLRLDEEGRPYVLEVNANPCVSEGAGYAAALTQAGISYQDFVSRLVHFALERGNPCACAR